MKFNTSTVFLALLVSLSTINCAKKNEKKSAQDPTETSATTNQTGPRKTINTAPTPSNANSPMPKPEVLLTAEEIVRKIEDHRLAEQNLIQQLQEFRSAELNARKNALSLKINSTLTEIAQSLGLKKIDIGAVKYPSTGRHQQSESEKFEVYEKAMIKRMAALKNALAHDMDDSNPTKGALKYQIQASIISNVVFTEKFKSASTDENGVRSINISTSVDDSNWQSRLLKTVAVSSMNSEESIDIFILTNAAADRAKLEAHLGAKIQFDKINKDRNNIRYPQQQMKKLSKLIKGYPALASKIIQLRPSLIQLSNDERNCIGGYDAKTGILVLPIGESFTKEQIAAKLN